MRYRLKCLTPLLVGDGRKLSPIDYMVWKDQVSVLDQWRIFRILAKGPRLDSYLAQLKNAEKLDFASWGGFAQNYAGRRIPFENAAYSAYWNRAGGESLHIPTFATGAAGPYLPATAIKGALRTGMLFAHWRDGMLQDVLARVKGERTQRVPPARSATSAGGGETAGGAQHPHGKTQVPVWRPRVAGSSLDWGATIETVRAGLPQRLTRRLSPANCCLSAFRLARLCADAAFLRFVPVRLWSECNPGRLCV
jgi:hypothetical protein